MEGKDKSHNYFTQGDKKSSLLAKDPKKDLKPTVMQQEFDEIEKHGMPTLQ